MKRLSVLVSAVCLVMAFGAFAGSNGKRVTGGDKASYWAFFVGGKASQDILNQQNAGVGGCQCAGCLNGVWAEQYFGYPNPFSDHVDWYFGKCDYVSRGWDLGRSHSYSDYSLPPSYEGWRKFYLILHDYPDYFTQGVLGQCKQDYFDPYAEPFCTLDGCDIPGAYKTTAAISSYDLFTMIDYKQFDNLNFWAPPPEDWHGMWYLHQDLMGDYNYYSATPWQKRFMLAAQLWIDSMGDYPVAKSLPLKNLDGNVKSNKSAEKYYASFFWARVMVHSLISWMEWEDGLRYYDALYSLGLEGWGVDHSLPPDFVYEIWGNTRFLEDSMPVGVADGLPSPLQLKSSPNPFNPRTSIDYSLSVGGQMSLKVYDLKGSLVKTLENGHKEQGNYKCSWDGTDSSGKRLSSGTYLLKLTSSGGSKTFKVMLAK